MKLVHAVTIHIEIVSLRSSSTANVMQPVITCETRLIDSELKSKSSDMQNGLKPKSYIKKCIKLQEREDTDALADSFQVAGLSQRDRATRCRLKSCQLSHGKSHLKRFAIDERSCRWVSRSALARPRITSYLQDRFETLPLKVYVTACDLEMSFSFDTKQLKSKPMATALERSRSNIYNHMSSLPTRWKFGEDRCGDFWDLLAPSDR